jgi:putative restriction endonuclease
VTADPVGVAPSQFWVTSLGRGHLENWIIVKESGLWGTPSRNGRKVRSGDELFVWRTREGWLARCIALTDAMPLTADNPAPWVDGTVYRWLFQINILAELDTPLILSATGAFQDMTGIAGSGSV